MKNVVITGACGQIAYHLIFSLLKGEVFGQCKVRLHLIDLEALQEKLEGIVMEIEDCAFPLLDKVNIFTDKALDKGFHNADFVFLVGASPRTEGMERSGLLIKNAEIFKTQGKALDNARQDCQVLVVGNPCNTNCLIVMNHCKTIPDNQFYAMSMLDENRARFQIAKLGQKDISKVHAYIYGNHSATQYPDYENSGVDVDDKHYQSLIAMLQVRGAEVIKKRGASSAASASHAAIATAHHLNNPSNALFSVASVSKGDYNAPDNLIVSMPHIHKESGVEVHSDFKHSDRAKKYMQASYDELQAEYEQIKAMGLLDA